MKTTLVLVLILLALIALAFYVPRVQVNRAIRGLVRLFRTLEATDPESAKAPEEVGLGARRTTDRVLRPRDYRVMAARVLLQIGVLQTTEDGRLYLSEEELERSPLKKSAGIP